jgi:glycosyltransferase involved in cell wall biosynthesis
MKLSIITINYNNAEGLKKTMESVLQQSSTDFEYIIVDGGSSDASLKVIGEQLSVITDQSSVIGEQLSENVESNCGEVEKNGIRVKWISERDKGIYHAMNKGIRMATGDYVQFLNSSDYIVSPDVTKQMINQLKVESSKLKVDILYGNMLKEVKGKLICDSGFAGRKPTLLDFYTGTLNHSPVYIRRSLFETFGMYDEELRFVSDWKWYVKAIIQGGVNPLYVNIDVIYFDMSGVSTANWDKTLQEKRTEMGKLFPESILQDYYDWAFGIEQLKRLKRYKSAYKLVYLIERLLFKYEKLMFKIKKDNH